MRGRRDGFTLVELLVVITILGVLVGLLVPVVWGAVRRAKGAQAEAQVNTLAAALASFRAKYGEYPPSRLVFHESGRLGTPPAGDLYFAGMPHAPDSQFPPIGGRPDGPAAGSQEWRDLVAKSVQAMRSIFPRVRVDSTSFADAPTSLAPGGGFYDINGNGVADAEPILLDGHECLYLFLCGVPDWQPGADGLTLRGAGGWHNDPRNPFRAVGSTAVDSRSSPLYEVTSPGQLSDDDMDGIPGILDPIDQSSNGRYVAYFSSTFGGYDPRDVRLEADSVVPWTVRAGNPPTVVPAIGPNPWTNGPTDGAEPPRYLRPQSFQLLSPGLDRRYGPGGAVVIRDGAREFPGGADRNAEEDNAGMR